jgi:cytochrome b561
MPRGTAILIGLLAISFAGMLAFLFVQPNFEPSQLGGYIGFGVLLVAIAAVSAGRKNRTSGSSAGSKHITGAFALAFGSWMLGSLLLLPVVGYAGFEMLHTPWFLVGFFALALAWYPVTKRYMR